MPSRPSEFARLALEVAHADPRRARQLATAVLSTVGGDQVSRALAEHALGLAAKEFLDLDRATTHLRRAIRGSLKAGEPFVAAQARTSLCFVLLSRGQTGAALREADRAAAVLRGQEAGQLHMRRALILQRLGRLDEALEGYRRAIQVFRRANDEVWEARVLCNRGVLHGYRMEFAAAERDLSRSSHLARRHGQKLAATQVHHNLGFVAARRGDVPTALRRFDAAEQEHRALGLSDWVGMVD
ncbi:MAG TPA: tetratricopeptide repeat protein, partial [Nitriliruptorales bacterium]|nr:tetratricopeptide repeat protein [Nitriliruptorales bacterium]